MATGCKITCKNCGFEAKVQSGFSATAGGRSFMFFGCPTCKKIMTFCSSRKGNFYIFLLTTPPSLKKMGEKGKESVNKGICPECGGKLIDYMSDRKEQQNKERHGGFTCPKCGKSALHMERTLDIF